MPQSQELSSRIVVDKARVELEALAQRGVVMAGNAFASYLILKGECTSDELSGQGRLLAGSDGKALRASLAALGYAPEDWVGLSSLADDGTALAPDLLRLAITTLDPATIVAEDAAAAQALRETYAEELSQEEQFEVAMLQPGYVAQVLGMRVMNLGGFEQALADAHKKQIMWSYLKLLPPLGEPY